MTDKWDVLRRLMTAIVRYVQTQVSARFPTKVQFGKSGQVASTLTSRGQAAPTH